MKIEYIWIIGLCIIISTIISLLLIKKYIKQMLNYSAAVSAGLIAYYKSTNNDEKETARDIVAQGLSLDYGTNIAAREWLAETCTDYINGDCDDCILWTCPGKKKKGD